MARFIRSALLVGILGLSAISQWGMTAARGSSTFTEQPTATIETLSIPANGQVVNTATVLQLNVTYQVTVSGTYRYDVGEPGEFADAQYREDDSDQWSIRWNSVVFDGVRLDATNSAYQTSHIYTFLVIGKGSPIGLKIYDESGTYGDNEGALVADIAVSSASGQLTSPGNGTVMGPSSLILQAQTFAGGDVSVASVEFMVFYDSVWHSAGLDTTSPYEVGWETPNLLHSQILKFAIHVASSNGILERNAGGIRVVEFRESLGSPDILENWIPTRYYLNQRANQIWPDCSCGASSMAMVLAMNGVIEPEQMKAKAEEMYRIVAPGDGCDGAWWSRMESEMMRQGFLASRPVIAAWSSGTVDLAWSEIKSEVDAGRPVIFGTISTRTIEHPEWGHIMVAVGYRESGTSHQVIAYDPYGKWLGYGGNYNYNTRDSASHKGQWVYYELGSLYAGNFLTTRRIDLPAFNALAVGPSTAPDTTSDEPETIGVAVGIPVFDQYLWLPSLRH